MQFKIVFLFLLVGLKIFSQADSLKFIFGSPISDGVYLTYNDFRRNDAISKEQINSKLDKSQLNFIEKSMAEKDFFYQKNNVSHTVNPKTIFGFIQNNTLYINHDGEFFRVPVFGSISYMIISVLVPVPAGMYFGTAGVMGGTTYTRELREFLMNFYDGKLVEMKRTTVENFLSRDKELFAEYKKLNRRKRNKEIYLYIRKFNERNPVYFLK